MLIRKSVSRMAHITVYVTLEVPDEVLEDHMYESTMDVIKSALEELADSLQGGVEDLEIK